MTTIELLLLLLLELLLLELLLMGRLQSASRRAAVGAVALLLLVVVVVPVTLAVADLASRPHQQLVQAASELGQPAAGQGARRPRLRELRLLLRQKGVGQQRQADSVVVRVVLAAALEVRLLLLQALASWLGLQGAVCWC